MQQHRSQYLDHIHRQPFTAIIQVNLCFLAPAAKNSGFCCHCWSTVLLHVVADGN